MINRLAILVFVAAATTACANDAPSPAAFDAVHEPCRFCRMTGSNGRTAAQLVAPGQEPLFFDDLGCLRGYLKQTGTVASTAVVYVADHRTGAWVAADRALYTRNEAVSTPMGSHLIAHESAESRDADPDARGGSAVSISDVFSGVPVPRSPDK